MKAHIETIGTLGKGFTMLGAGGLGTQGKSWFGAMINQNDSSSWAWCYETQAERSHQCLRRPPLEDPLPPRSPAALHDRLEHEAARRTCTKQPLARPGPAQPSRPCSRRSSSQPADSLRRMLFWDDPSPAPACATLPRPVALSATLCDLGEGQNEMGAVSASKPDLAAVAVVSLVVSARFPPASVSSCCRSSFARGHLQPPWSGRSSGTRVSSTAW